MFASNRHSAPLNSKRMSIGNRLSLGLGLTGARDAFTVEEAKSGHATDLALRIGKKDPNLPCQDDRKYTPLHVACALGKEDVVNMILSQDNASLNSKAKLGLTPLIVACGSKQWKIVHILVAAGADLKLYDACERTAYDIAMEAKAPESILALLFPKRNGNKVASSAGGPSPFSSIVGNDSSITINLNGGM